jgi:putative ABC transport system permease protein
MNLLQINFREAFRSLWGARQRSLLALIGIVIGIGSVIGMVSIATIVQQEALRQFRDMGVDIVVIRKNFGHTPQAEFTLDNVQTLTAEEPNILAVAPYLTATTELARGRQKMSVERMGVTSDFFDLNKLQVRQGRALSDLDQNRYFCVVGAELADFLGKGTGSSGLLGTSVAVEDRSYRIIGILENVTEGGLRPYGLNRAILVPLSTALRTFSNASINAVMARVSPQAPAGQIKAEIQNHFLKKSRGLQVDVTSAEELIERMKKQMRMFSLLLGAIGSIALIVGGIGVMNVMLISVSERRSEIGLRRALGAQQSDIQSQFLIESILLCLAGGLIGIVLGTGIAYLFAAFSKWPFTLSYASIALGFGVSTLVGVFCGFYPARTAAKLDPIKALRS